MYIVVRPPTGNRCAIASANAPRGIDGNAATAPAPAPTQA